MSQAIRSILYIGNKAQKADNVTDSGLVWQRGQVLPVPVTYASQLVKYPDVWKDVTGMEPKDLLALEPEDTETALRRRNAELEEKVLALREEVLALREQLGQAPDPHAGADSEGGRDMGMPRLNLHGMRKAEILAFAQRELQVDLDLKDQALTKEELIAKIGAIMASRPDAGRTD
jgi:hypothetical protein